MKQYKVTVNGTPYEITLEVVDADDVKAPNTTAAASAPVEAPASAPASAPTAAPVTSGGETVTSPMPGTILAVNVQNGQAVKEGDVLMVLEAMKMENEIMAPCSGNIASVSVTKGTAVESGTVLCVIA